MTKPRRKRRGFFVSRSHGFGSRVTALAFVLHLVTVQFSKVRYGFRLRASEPVTVERHRPDAVGFPGRIVYFELDGEPENDGGLDLPHIHALNGRRVVAAAVVTGPVHVDSLIADTAIGADLCEDAFVFFVLRRADLLLPDADVILTVRQHAYGRFGRLETAAELCQQESSREGESRFFRNVFQVTRSGGRGYGGKNLFRPRT